MKVACLLLALLAAHAPSLEGQRKTQQEWWAETIDYESAELGFKTLRNAPPVEGRQLRAWVGFGIFAPEYVVTITEQRGKVTGSKLLYWSLESDSADEAESERDANRVSTRELGEEVKGQFGCERIQKTESRYYCEATLAPGQSWISLLGDLDSFGIQTLRDESEVIKPGRLGLDGVTLLVEVRHGAKYRLYSYWSPDTKSSYEEVRRASAILDVLETIGFRKN